LSGSAHYAPDHAGHVPGRAVITARRRPDPRGPRVRAGRRADRPAPARFPARRGPARGFRPRPPLVLAAAARTVCVPGPQACAVLLPPARAGRRADSL